MTTTTETPAQNIDQQDCPVIDQDDNECGFVGEVMRYAIDGEDTENGYTWTCPDCGSENIWEGPEEDWRSNT